MLENPIMRTRHAARLYSSLDRELRFEMFASIQTLEGNSKDRHADDFGPCKMISSSFAPEVQSLLAANTSSPSRANAFLGYDSSPMRPGASSGDPHGQSMGHRAEPDRRGAFWISGQRTDVANLSRTAWPAVDDDQPLV